MASQDVIHSFFMPAFRVKHDVVPGRYQNLWFKAEKAGVFQLLCAEYCGTDHSRMIGRIVVMEPPDYRNLAGATGCGRYARQRGRGSLSAARVQRLSCRGSARSARPPSRAYSASRCRLQDGNIVIADERYIRDSILIPQSQMAAGYAPVMPSFAGRVSEDELHTSGRLHQIACAEAGLQQ